jgi:hypothetical protein
MRNVELLPIMPLISNSYSLGLLNHTTVNINVSVFWDVTPSCLIIGIKISEYSFLTSSG